MPAVVAELCLEASVATSLHNMLIRIRLFKQGPNKGKLRASAAHFPKREPWFDILTPAPCPIISILASRKARRLDSITMRGERGDTRELRPHVFLLKCPSCGTFRDCVNVKLFTTTARGLTCSTCRKSTSSTKWCCEHGSPWTSCPEHRETGFRCGTQRLHLRKATSKGSFWVGSLKALKSRQARASRLGSLGEPKRLPVSIVNSVGPSAKKRTMVQKKT